MANEIEEHEGLQMSFLDHLDELRKRLIHSVVAIAIAFGLCFYFSKQVFDFLAVPVKLQMQKVRRAQMKANGEITLDQLKEGEVIQYTFTMETSVNGVKIPLGTTVAVKMVRKDNKPLLVLAQPWSVGATVVPAETSVKQLADKGQSELVYNDENNQLMLTGVTSAFMLYMWVSFYAAIALSVPVLLYQVWAFVSPGLYKHEKRYIIPVLLMGTVLFITGASFAYKVAFPAACDYLLGWAAEGGFRIMLEGEGYLNLIIMIMLGMGIVFQIPTLSFILGRVGLLTPRMMIRAWRYAIVVIAIVAAVLTPTPDVGNMILFAAPMVALYFLSIGVVWLFGKPRQTDEEVRALAHSK